jgi:uncharacterized protein (DUF58 family)
MTCEYESEVPIRTTIFADLTPVQYRGRPRAARADRIISVCASVARMLLTDRDPVACLICHGTDRIWVPHGLGERHLTQMVSQFLSREPGCETTGLDLATLCDVAWNGMVRREPELVEPGLLGGIRKWSRWPWRRSSQWRQRREMSALFAARDRGSPGLAVRLQVDNGLFRRHCERLLADAEGVYHLQPVSLPRSAEAERAAIESICGGLVGCISRARDNELFIVVCTIPRDRAAQTRLEEAIRLARGKRHRVMVIDVGRPKEEVESADPVAWPVVRSTVMAAGNTRSAATRRLRSLGAKVARLDDHHLFTVLATEMELLKSGRGRVGDQRR